MNLGAIDLNLLRVLQALHEERSVSGAARRLGLSQSATSHALSRLRDVVGDELYTRVGHEMVATPRAEALALAIGPALAAIGAALDGGAAFDPSRAGGTVRIAGVDLAQVLLLPELALAVAADAPGVQLVVVPIPDDPQRSLATGAVDLVVGGMGQAPDLRRAQLGVDPFVCVVRCDHTCLSDGLTVDRFTALPHALVTPLGVARGYVDGALARIGRTRDARYVTPQLWSAAIAVSRSDLVLTTASRMARLAAQTLPLALIDPPLAIPPYALSMSWHPRRDPDALHTWIRLRLTEIAARSLDPFVHEIDSS